MNDTNIGIVILARVGSKRLPEKVLRKVEGKETIKILIEHLRHCKLPVILAIPNKKEDDILVKIADEMGVKVYRGEDNSPLHRLNAVAELYDFEHVVRVTADNIIIDPLQLKNQIDFHIRRGLDYTYCTRILLGAGAEVVRTSALVKIAEKHQGENIEYLTYYIRHNPKYNTKEFYVPYEYQYYARCTLDYYEDLILLRILFSEMRNPGTLDIINYIKNRQYLMRINHLPRVSIYVTNYNYSKYIKQCLDSIVNQTYKDYELLIFDDGSNDLSSDEILNWYTDLHRIKKDRVFLYRNKENEGLPKTCNKALMESRGQYIVRVDADDLLMPDCIEKMINNIGDKSAIVSGFYECNENLEIQNEINKNEYHPACALLNKQCAYEIKYREGLDYFDGVHFWNNFLKNFSMEFINEPLWFYRKHEKSKTVKKNIEGKKDALVEALR